MTVEDVSFSLMMDMEVMVFGNVKAGVRVGTSNE